MSPQILKEIPMASRSGTRRGRHTGPNPIPPKPQDIIVQQQPQPIQPQPQPPVPMDDEALAILWAPYEAVVRQAEEAARLALPFEQAAAKARKNANDKRAEAERLRAQAEQALMEAADFDAAVVQHERDARPHRQDENNHRKNANQVANAVRFLTESNGKTHPQVRLERDAQMAAANGQQTPASGQHMPPNGQHAPHNGQHPAPSGNHDPLSAPIGDLVANGAAVNTAPFAAPEVR